MNKKIFPGHYVPELRLSTIDNQEGPLDEQIAA
jgi:hypothetical protein